MTFKRDVSETFQSPRNKYAMLMQNIDNISACLSPKLLFIRTLQALTMAGQKRALMLTVWDSRRLGRNVMNLRPTTLNLFGPYIVHFIHDPTFVAGEPDRNAGNYEPGESYDIWIAFPQRASGGKA